MKDIEQARLSQEHHVEQLVHGGGPLGKVNTWLAIKVTNIVGTMWCAYAFAALALIAFPDAIRSGNLNVVVAWTAQTFLQLVLLSVILVGQRVQSVAVDNQAAATRVNTEVLLTLSSELHTITSRDQMQKLDAILECLASISVPSQAPPALS